MTLTYFELGDIRVAQEHQGDPDGGVVLGIGDLVRSLSVADAMELAQALLDQMQPALPDQVICAPPKGCGAAVIWLKTTAGRPTPVDPRKVVVCSADGSYHTGYESHFASCPNRGNFRKGKKG